MATQYAQQLLTASSPVEVLANTVMHDPQYETVHAHFNATASALLGLVGRALRLGAGVHVATGTRSTPAA